MPSGKSETLLIAYYAGSPVGVSMSILNISQGTLVIDTTNQRVYQKTSTTDNSTFNLLAIASGDTLTNAVLVTPTITDSTEVVTATNIITASETGKTFFLNSATEFVSTLPAPAAGLNFEFIVTAAPSGASYTIVTNSSANIIKGSIVTSATGAADTEVSGGDTISFVDGQAVAGDRVVLRSDGTNWFCYGICSVAAGITITTAS